MTQPKIVVLLCLLFISTAGICQSGSKENVTLKAKGAMSHQHKIQKTDEEWRKELSAEEYKVLRQKGTERAWTGEYNDHKEKGVYTCAACGNELFSSEAKFESGSGWPSFFQPVDKEALADETDKTFGMVRTEVLCNDCGGHLGHVFSDGPKPTGLRYCINSISLDFKKK